MRSRFMVVVLLLFCLTACSGDGLFSKAQDGQLAYIPFDSPFNSPEKPIADMAWFQDALVILPRNPEGFESGLYGSLFYLKKQDLLDYLDGRSQSPLKTTPVVFNAGGLEDAIPGYQGYTAMTFFNGRIYLLVDAELSRGVRTYLVSGLAAFDLSEIRLNVETLQLISLPQGMPAHTYEGLLTAKEFIYAVPALNIQQSKGERTMPFYTADLEYREVIDFPALDMPIIAVSPVDVGEHFWGLPGAGTDSAAQHLLEFQYFEAYITRTERPAIEITLEGETRRFTALTLLDQRGLLLAGSGTPRAMLALQPLPESKR